MCEKKPSSEIEVAILPPVIATVADYVLLFSALAYAASQDSLIIKFLTAFLVARQFHALAILFHEASHYNITRIRKVDNFLGDWVFGSMQFFSIKAYRVLHTKHHSFLLKEKDPDHRLYNDYPMTFSKFLVKRAGRDLLGRSWMKTMTYFNYPGRKEELYLKRFFVHHLALIRGTSWIVVMGYLAYLNGNMWDLAILWLFPLFCIFPLMLRVRAMIEHGGLTDIDEHNDARSTRSTNSLILRILICPHNIGFHAEHHLNPAVPYYNLPRLSERLRKEVESPVLLPTYGANSIVRELFGNGLAEKATASRKVVSSEIVLENNDEAHDPSPIKAAS